MINNDFYETLEEGWYDSWNHPIALLRLENQVRAPWMAQEIKSRFNRPINILDIGCGGGFLTNHLAAWGHHVTGIDLSETSLNIAKRHDETKSVHYLKADAYALPFPDHSFDAVSAMDILEHVENPSQLIQEASRVLKPKGFFFFHTFNRNFLSYLIIIKGVDWFVPNAPANMHVYPLFITPQELQKYCLSNGLKVIQLQGFMPKIFSKGFWRLLFTRKISPDFSFTFTRSLSVGYTGIAQKI